MSSSQFEEVAKVKELVKEKEALKDKESFKDKEGFKDKDKEQSKLEFDKLHKDQKDTADQKQRKDKQEKEKLEKENKEKQEKEAKEKQEKNEPKEKQEKEKHEKEIKDRKDVSPKEGGKEPKDFAKDKDPKDFSKEIEKVQIDTPFGAGQGIDPATNQRLLMLEASVAQLLHFIPATMRPDLSTGALSQEPDGGKPDTQAGGATESGDKPE